MSATQRETLLTLPDAQEAEEAVVGALLLAGALGRDAAVRTLDAVRAAGLDRDSFGRDSIGVIFAAIEEVVARGEPSDLIVTAAELMRREQLDRVGGDARLSELVVCAASVSNASHHAALVVDAARRRDEMRVAGELERAAKTGGLAAHPHLRERIARLIEPNRRGEIAHSQMVDGWSFVSGVSDTYAANWGEGDRVLWAEGEPLMLVGPDGVGKTSLGQQLTLARLGVRSELLGFPVAPSRARVMYLAADRPAQAARSLRRMVGTEDEDMIREGLLVHRGPLPFDVVREPAGTLRDWVGEHACSDLVVDALKDLAIELVKDEVASAVSRAFQACVAADIEVLCLHHQRKAQQGASAPRTISDVYGNRWLTAGMGSVVLLWGEPGDLVVQWKQLKQPAEEVGPFKVLHDHVRGLTTVHDHVGLEQLLGNAAHGLVVKEAARLLYENDDPKANEVEKARRQLEGLIGRNRAERRDDPDGTARYFPKQAA